MNLPHRFRESSFRFYEPFIRFSLQRWPEVVSVRPGDHNLSPETFAARCRDAITSLLNYRWATDIDVNRLSALRKELAVRMQKDRVLIGPMEKMRQSEPAPPESFITEGPTAPVDIPKRLRAPELELLAWLAHNRLLTQPISFRAEEPGMVISLTGLFDIDVEQVGEDRFTLT